MPELLSIEKLKSSKNVAELLSEEELGKISIQVLDGYEIDENSRAEWKDLVANAMEIAKQTTETKNHPFTNSSNVKYPLITKAAIDYAARTYPELIQNDRVVKPAVVGNDPDGQKLQKAIRVSKCMSYQLLYDMESWEEGVDKLLHILPIVGTVFKKTYFNPLIQKPVSELCSPDKIVVNYNSQSLEEARRITHIVNFHTNDVIERIRAGLYLDVDISKLCSADGYEDDQYDPTLELLEQHCYLDLDDDGYKEPYIVILHKASGQVLRIVNRFKSVKKNDEGEVSKIEPEHYFTDFHFIRSPDGGFYSMGLGTLLYPFNAALNTLINQLIDSGTLNNNQSGFIGRGLRLKNGEIKLGLGEWKVVDAATGINLQQNIVPLPTKEPSTTLLQLLQMLVETGKDLISNTDAMQGKGQTQNVAATTVLAMVEQGMKVYNAISKRLYKALQKEIIKVFNINKQYLTNKKYQAILDDELADVKTDFDLSTYDIVPVANPAMASDAQRLARAQAIMALPTLDPQAASQYYLESLQLEESVIQKLLPPKDPNAPPPPEVQKLMAEVERTSAEAKAKIVEAQVLSESHLLETAKLNIQRDEALVRADESAARVFKMKQDALHNAAKIELAGAKAEDESQLAQFDRLHQREKDEVDLSIRTIDSLSKLKDEEDDADKS